MRVLVLHSELGVMRGGGENVTRNLFLAFAKRGHRVSAAFTANRGGRYPLPLPSGIEPLPIPGWWSSSFGQAALSAVGQSIPWRSRWRAKWDRVQEALAWRTFAWHKRRFQRRILSTLGTRWTDVDAVYVHGDVILASEVARFRPTVLRLPGPVAAECTTMLRAVDAVCANGDVLVRTRAFLGDHVTELPVGLDLETFAPGASSVRSTLGWDSTDCVVGYVGRLTHLKGVDLLAAAFREVARGAPDARLLIVGSGEHETHMRVVLAGECAAGRVHIQPGVSHEQLPLWYRAMDLMVMPSRYENHSNALLEAMACGIPFLASDTGGNRQLSETGAGWLFEPGSIPSLARHLQQILGNRSELKVRGELSLRSTARHDSWDACAERLERIIASTIRRRADRALVPAPTLLPARQ
jgi:glycosyltransferase involved in cell wall biosynthesis